MKKIVWISGIAAALLLAFQWTGAYEKAAGSFAKTEDSSHSFLNSGNASFRLGDAAEDTREKMQYYLQAYQAYREGILRFPQDVPLKYNYETVKEKIEELLEDMEGENGGQNEEGDSREDQEQGGQNQEGADGEQSQGQESQDESAENSRQEQEQAAQQNDRAGEDPNEGQYEDPQQREGEQDREAIARILEILESQEDESLKNNREVVGGKEERYGW